MSEWNIINSAGTVVATAKKVEYHGKLMDERYVTVDIDSPVRLDLTAGDYMIYRGDKFTLRDSSEVEKSARPQSYGGAFTYKGLKLVAQSWQELHDTEMTDYVYGENKMHYTGLGTFSFYMTKVSDMGYRVQAVMDNKYGVGKWVVKIGGIAISGNYSDVEVDDAKSISISSGTSVKDTLDMLWSEWGYYYKVTSGIVNNEIVHYVDLCPSVGTTLPLYYGKKRTEVIAGEEKEVGGLVKIVRKINPNVEICTRVRAYGSERNLPYHWYNNKYGDQTNPYDPLRSMYIPQLMLPHTVAYYDEDGNYCDEDGNLYEANDPAVWDSERQARRSVNLWEYPNDVVLENVITSDKFGKRDKEVHWNSEDMGEIFPSMKGMMSDDIPAMEEIYGDHFPLDQVLGFHYASESDTGSSSPEDVTSDKLNFVVRVPNPGFNPTDHNTSDNVELLMQSGMCQARAFTIIKSEAVESDDKIVAYDLTCAKIIDEEIDQVFPNSPDFEIEAEDEYVYTGLEFNGDYSQDTWLDVYISAAEMRLLRAAAMWLREHSREEYIHEVSIDNVFMKTVPNISANLLEGASVKVTDNNIGSDKTDIVESVTITEGKDAIPTYEITFLRRDESESLGDRVKGLVGQSISASSEIAKANDGLAKKVNKTGFHTLFDPLDAQYNVLDINGDLSNLKYIRANVDFFSVKGVSALGTGGPGGGGGGGASTLNELDDVTIQSPQNGQYLSYNSSTGMWENVTGGGGGGVTLREPLSSINNASLGTPTESGQVLTWNGSQWIYAIPQGGGGGGTGTVTSITAGTGLSGGTITTMGTIAISSEYQTLIANGQTAYGWGNHANAGYLTSSDIADMATKTWVNQQGFVTANNYLTGVSGSANGVMTFAREGLSSLDFDSRHTHSNYVSSIYYNNSATLTSPYYVVTSGSVNGNTMTLGRSKLSDLLNAAGYTWWGQPMSASGVVSGDISMNIGDRIYFDNKNTLEVDAYSVALGYGYRTTKPIGLYGSAIDFYPNGSNVASVTSDGVIVGTSDSDENHYIQIGGCRLCWDDDNNSLYVIGTDDEPCNFYSLGGVSALGAGVDGGGGVSLNALLNSINSSSIGSTAPSASNVGKCLVWTANGWAWGTTGSSSGGTVTSVGLSMPTGFTVSGSPITSSGTLSVSIATGYFIPTTIQRTTWNNKQDAIRDLLTIRTNAMHGDTAYNSLSNYLPLAGGTMTGALHMGSATGESPYIYWGDGTYVYIGEDSDDHMTIRGARGVNILTGSNYELEWNGNTLATQDWVEGQGLATQDWVEGQGYVTSSGVTSVATGTGLTGGTITTSGTISINSTYQTYISHGESAYGWGNHADQGYMLRTEGMRFADYGSYIAARFVTKAGLDDSARATKAQGSGYIEWWSSGGYFNHELGFLNAKGNVTVGTSNTDTTHYLQIGGGRIYWDNTNNALYVKKADGTACHFYSLGGISALGVGGGSSSASIDSLDVTDLSVGNTLNLNGNSIYMDGGDITDAYTIYTNQLCVGNGSVISKIYWNGTYLQVQIGSSTYNFRPV